jgi:poly-gamma-glutamate synthesis protein (capsule biosynthesis protein)
VINLECPVSQRGTLVPKEFNFRCDPAALPAARAAGVEVANLANNHSGDYGPVALLDSVELVRDAGIVPVGVGADVEEANTPAVVEVGGWTVAVLGFGGVVPAPDWLATDSRPGMADGDDIEAMTEAIRRADEGADLVFVSIHWGKELDTEPQPEDVERAEAMIDAGADGIFGHHSHRLQPLGEHAGRPIAWGPGQLRVAAQLRGGRAHRRRPVRGGARRVGDRLPAARRHRHQRTPGAHRRALLRSSLTPGRSRGGGPPGRTPPPPGRGRRPAAPARPRGSGPRTR